MSYDSAIVENGGNGGINSDILNETGIAGIKRTGEDIGLVGRAVRLGWPVSPAAQRATVGRLVKLVRKDTCKVMSREGPVQLDGPADANAVRAAAVLVSMTGENQKDRHEEEKYKRIDQGKATELHAFQSGHVEELPLPPGLGGPALPPADP